MLGNTYIVTIFEWTAEIIGTEKLMKNSATRILGSLIDATVRVGQRGILGTQMSTERIIHWDARQSRMSVSNVHQCTVSLNNTYWKKIYIGEQHTGLKFCLNHEYLHHGPQQGVNINRCAKNFYYLKT